LGAGLHRGKVKPWSARPARAALTVIKAQEGASLGTTVPPGRRAVPADQRGPRGKVPGSGKIR